MGRWDKRSNRLLETNTFRVWLSLVEYSVWGGGVVGSNPTTRTNKIREHYMKTVSVELTEDELMWLQQIYSSRVKLANNIIERTPDLLTPEFEKYYNLDKQVLEKINKVVDE